MIRNILAKIRFYPVSAAALMCGLLVSCSAYVKIPKGEHLVTANKVEVNGKKQMNPEFSPYIRQVPNKKMFFFFPVKMNLYDMAREDPQAVFDDWKRRRTGTVKLLGALFSQKGINRIDSVYVGYNRMLRSIGEAPVIYDPSMAKRTVNNIEGFYFDRGYFNVKASSKAVFDGQDATVEYSVQTSRPYVIDSVNTDIESETLRELYERTRDKSLIKSGEIYTRANMEGEIARLSDYFKQNGVYDFINEYIQIQVDTNGYNNRAQILLKIDNVRRQTSSGTYSVPFHKWNVSRINVYTDYQYDNQSEPFTDTVTHNGLTIIGREKIKYRPRVISDAVFIRPGEVFSLSDYAATYRALRNLRLFSTVSVTMNPDSLAPEKDVVADIYLSPVKKYAANANVEVSRSSLLGIGTSVNLQVAKYNAFRGGEIWNNSLRVTLGSYNAPDGSHGFLNAYEVNLTTSLIFPRFLLPFNTEGIVPKRFSPKTSTSLGFGVQKNVGLDRTYFNFSLDYSWDQSRTVQHKIGLIKFSFLSNTNKYNYFNIFNNNERNDVVDDYLDAHPELVVDNPPDAGKYMYDIEQIMYNDQQFKSEYPDQYRVIADDMYQYTRYTSDFVIPAISYTFTFNNQRYDKTRDFHYLQLETTFSGNLFNALSGVFNMKSRVMPTGETVHEVFGVPFAQFAKFNINYSRYFNLGRNKANVLAYRVYFGVTVPYGNSQSQIPFSETYFGGGVNYERGWKAYELGPGSVSDKTHTYNIGNLKFTASLEYRFPLYRSLHGAVFFDTGNVWYTSSKMYSDERGVFSFDRFYKELSLTSGLGLRYDFKFFIARLDMGLKTVDPSLPAGHRWALFKDGMGGAAFQFALAYPF